MQNTKTLKTLKIRTSTNFTSAAFLLSQRSNSRHNIAHEGGFHLLLFPYTLRMKYSIFIRATAALCLMATLNAYADQQFPVLPLTAGMYVIQAEVAATEAQRQQGLMFREKLASNSGMVFLFGQPARVCMWMKNTLVPLSVAFLDGHGKILNIEDMQPQTTNSHCAAGPAVYALEMNRGWFAQKNIKPGTVIAGLPKAQ
jgi:uncharacterized membrane protein (UPF0127 family)